MKKNLLSWMTVMLMAFVCVGFAACGDDEEDNNNNSGLIGSWFQEDEEGDYTILTFSSTEIVSTALIRDDDDRSKWFKISTSMKYTLNGNRMTFSNGAEATYSINGSTLFITWTYDEEEETEKFTRMNNTIQNTIQKILDSATPVSD